MQNGQQVEDENLRFRSVAVTGPVHMYLRVCIYIHIYTVYVYDARRSPAYRHGIDYNNEWPKYHTTARHVKYIALNIIFLCRSRMFFINTRMEHVVICFFIKVGALVNNKI